MKISVVINTLNEEKNIKRCLESVHELADEIVICDDGSTDKTVEIAKEFTDKIFHHQSKGYVEAARNFALSKSKSDWILVIDADEEIPKTLTVKLRGLATSKKQQAASFVSIPRKNIIFGKWIKHSGWWPDYNVRFFKKGKVVWSEKIHEDPKTAGKSLKLEPEEKLAIVHHNYDSIDQYISRLNRYTEIESQILIKEGYKFDWRDLVSKPTGEFLSRYFAREGYKDDLHGFVLAILQSFSFFVTYLKVWEKGGFEEKEIDVEEVKEEFWEKTKDIRFWFFKVLSESERGIRKLVYKISKRV